MDVELNLTRADRSTKPISLESTLIYDMPILITTSDHHPSITPSAF